MLAGCFLYVRHTVLLATGMSSGDSSSPVFDPSEWPAGTHAGASGPPPPPMDGSANEELLRVFRACTYLLRCWLRSEIGGQAAHPPRVLVRFKRLLASWLARLGWADLRRRWRLGEVEVTCILS